MNRLAWSGVHECYVVARESWRVTTRSRHLAEDWATILAPQSRRRSSGVLVESLSMQSTATTIKDLTAARLPAVLAVE